MQSDKSQYIQNYCVQVEGVVGADYGGEGE